jgi:ankyrin repeat protein
MKPADRGYSLKLSIAKPKLVDSEDFNIFNEVYQGRLTAIVDYFESLSPSEIDLLLSDKDDKGNTLLHIAAYLGFKNIVLYFLKWKADPRAVDSKQRNTFHFL